jgi:hypothetical protein
VKLGVIRYREEDMMGGEGKGKGVSDKRRVRWRWWVVMMGCFKGECIDLDRVRVSE